MRREEREQILKQGVVAPRHPAPGASGRARGGHPLQRAPRAAAAAPPPQLPSRSGRIPVRPGRAAALHGAARTITELTQEHERRLAARWRELAGAGSTRRRSRRLEGRVETWSFDEVNDLIDRHNRFYPAESRLPMDPRTGDYALVGGEDYRRRRLDAQWGARALSGRARPRRHVTLRPIRRRGDGACSGSPPGCRRRGPSRRGTGRVAQGIGEPPRSSGRARPRAPRRCS